MLVVHRKFFHAIVAARGARGDSFERHEKTGIRHLCQSGGKGAGIATDFVFSADSNEN